MRKPLVMFRGVKMAGVVSRMYGILSDFIEFLAELLWFCGPR